MIITSSSFGAKKVFVTAGGGNTWTELTGNLPDLPVRWSMFYPGSNTQILLATEAGIWYNTNGVSNGNSTNWMPSPGFPAVRSDMIKYSASMGTAVVGTHGRGLWTANLSTNPKVAFYNSLLSASKNFGSSITGCRTYMDYPDTVFVSAAPNGAATVTLSTQSGGTAVEGVDFDFTTTDFNSPSHVATFSTGTYPNKIPILIRVYNTHDKNAVLPQTASIGIAVSGTTDAVASAANQTVTINFTDVLPSTSTLTAQTLWTENWETASDSYANWTFSPDTYHNKLPNTIGFIPYYSSCSSNVNGVTAQLATTDGSGNVSLCANGINGAYTARMYRMVNAANNRYSAMSVAFNYRSGTTTAIVNSLVYSIDNGATWTSIATYPARSAAAPTAVTTTIPTTLNNTNFLLGWQSVGSASAVYSAYGFGVDDIVLTGTIAPSPIDSTAGSADTNYVATNQSIDFYSAKNNILANISNPSQTLACTNVMIENAGTTWQPFSGGTRSQKTFYVTPSQNSSASYTATFYFTNAELAGMNTGTLRIAKTTASSIAQATNSNTVLVTPTAVTTYSINGVANGVSFTGAFSGFSRFFLVDGNVAVPIAFTTCPTTNLAIARPGYNTYNNEPVSMYMMDTATGIATLIPGGPLKDPTTNKNIDINGTGVNALDGYVYGLRDTVNTAGTAASPMLYRIGSNYSAYVVGTLPAPSLLGGENLAVVNPAAGSFDDQGNYYYIGMAGSYSFTNNTFTPSSYYIGKLTNVAALTAGTSMLAPTWTKIDFSNVACGSYKTSASTTISSSSGAGAGTSFQDIAYSNLYRSLYVYAAYQASGSYVGQLLSINPTTGVATCYATTPSFGASNNEVAGISTTTSGSLRIFMTSGDVYKTNAASDGTYTGTITKIGASGIPPLGVTGSIRGDLASCSAGPTTLPATRTIGLVLPNDIVAYPNPANGLTTITVGQILNNATVRLVGVTGNIITERSGVSGTTFQMDLTGKPGGMYMVEVIQGGNVQKVKIIKE
eukprot:gnl/Spiro4/9699_TR5157_c0_g1_i1.p1 gnl/Spiro4/9699_TR5157_c0_g1~~gnl/Spiro4/9699_TR5157_c0_g1_i1.p1  ORF type:complete len:1009 (+),score=-108.50 gnl/Spiro4/9699_TR5157_c0_g1_i1:245-3271(+)